MDQVWDNKAIICDALGRAPNVEFASIGEGWSLCRWRQFIGGWELPPMPDATFIVHISGKPDVRTWMQGGWSENKSIPGCATTIPAGMPTGWLLDGELDVVTLSVSSDLLKASPRAAQFERMQFAFADPLGVALTRQILAELYAPDPAEREAYVAAMVNALKAHILAGPAPQQHGAQDGIPVTEFSAYRLHTIMNAVLARPEDDHSLERMAATAGVTPSHFCRIFRKATGMSPHQYVLKARLDRAQSLLTQSGNSIASISESLGFTSQSHFSRAFRNYAGVAPSEYRQSRPH